jgi:hypothetical protein
MYQRVEQVFDIGAAFFKWSDVQLNADSRISYIRRARHTRRIVRQCPPFEIDHALQLALEYSPVEGVEDQEWCFLAEGCLSGGVKYIHDAGSVAVEMLVTVGGGVFQRPAKIAMADKTRLCQLFKYLINSRKPIISLAMALSEVVRIVAFISATTAWAVDDWR